MDFDWKKAEELWPKIEEEITELKQAVEGGKHEEIEEEIGDLLFTVANLSRKLDINPEEALHSAVKKFENRFKKMERILEEQGTPVISATFEQMDQAWERVKGKV